MNFDKIFFFSINIMKFKLNFDNTITDNVSMKWFIIRRNHQNILWKKLLYLWQFFMDQEIS